MTTIQAPSKERLAKAGDFDVPHVDQRSRRTAFRIIGVVEGMERTGRLRREQVTAFQRFEKDLSLASRSSHTISRYGDEAGAGGTPLSQLSTDMLSMDERQSDVHRNIAAAVRAMSEPRTVEAVTMAAVKDTNLEQIGKLVLLIGNKTQAIASAARTLQMGTYLLALHYGYIDKPTYAHARPPG